MLIAVTTVRPVMSIVFVDCSSSDSGAVFRDCRCSFVWFIIKIFILKCWVDGCAGRYSARALSVSTRSWAVRPAIPAVLDLAFWRHASFEALSTSRLARRQASFEHCGLQNLTLERRCEIDVPQWAQTGEPLALTLRGLMVAEVSLGVVNIISIWIGGMFVGEKGECFYLY